MESSLSSKTPRSWTTAKHGAAVDELTQIERSTCVILFRLHFVSDIAMFVLKGDVKLQLTFRLHRVPNQMNSVLDELRRVA